MDKAAQRRVSAWRYFLLGCWLCLAPLLVSHYPPLVDIPQHAAQIAGIAGRLDGGWPYSAWFEIRPFTPYWLGYGLVLALTPVFGVLLATKMVLGAAVVAFPWAAGRFCRAWDVPPSWFGWLLPLSLGFAFQWGYLNFVVAMPLAFLFLASVRSLLDGPRHRAWIAIALWGHLLFFAHILIAGFACAIACLQQATPGRGFRQWLWRVAPFASLLPITLIWLGVTLTGGSQVHEPVQWDIGAHRIPLIIARLVAAPETPAGIALGLAALAFPWVTGATWRRDAARWSPLVLFVAFVLLFPAYVMGNGSTASRFVVFGLPLYFACFESATAARHTRIRWGPVTATIAVALIGWNTLRASIVDVEARGYRAVTSELPRGRRVLSLMFDNESFGSTAPVFLHFTGWYQVESNGFVEPSFSRFYGVPLGLADDRHSAIGMWFAWHPERLDWEPAHGSRYDYLIVRSRTDPRPWLDAASGCAVIPLRHSGEWWLFGRGPAADRCAVVPVGKRPPTPR